MIYKPEYFKNKEFYEVEKIEPILLFILDKTRKKFGEFVKCSFIIISSNEPHHRHYPGSKHYDNKAVDFYVKIKDNSIIKNNQQIMKRIVYILTKLCFWDNVGIGFYINEKGYLSIHLDYREKNGKWFSNEKDSNGNWIYKKLDLMELSYNV